MCRTQDTALFFLCSSFDLNPFIHHCLHGRCAACIRLSNATVAAAAADDYVAQPGSVGIFYRWCVCRAIVYIYISYIHVQKINIA